MFTTAFFTITENFRNKQTRYLLTDEYIKKSCYIHGMEYYLEIKRRKLVKHSPLLRASLVAQLVKESACKAGDPSLIPGSGSSLGEGIGYPLSSILGLPFPGKESACNLGVGKIPWRRKQLPTPVFWPGEFHGLYSPWGRKEWNTAEQLSHYYYVYRTNC